MSDSLSTLANAVRYVLVEATNLPAARIVIGPPHEAAKQQEKAPDEDYLCVFFYRIGYSGFPADAVTDDPLYMKAFCMITALGGSSGEKTPGDSELRLIGAVAECFHKNPVLKLENSGHVQAQIQIIPMQLTLDDINHLWSTQNNTPYRLSLSYEFALLPVPMKDRAAGGAAKVKTISITAVGRL